MTEGPTTAAPELEVAAEGPTSVARTPRLIAVYGQRHEPDWLVADMLTNLTPLVDGFAFVDDRARPAGEAWGHEGDFREAQREAAIAEGADWVLVVDPDERLEDRAAEVIRPLLGGPPTYYRFRLRELFAPNAYRVDGRWGMIRRTRLYPVQPGQVMSRKPIHTPPIPIAPALPTVTLDLNLYHLKMIEPANRPARGRAYAAAEIQHRAPRRAWSGLSRTLGMRLEPVPAGRGFSPAYTRPYLLGRP